MSSPDDREPDGRARWIAVARPEDIPEGESRAYEVGGEWIALSKVEGEIHAVEDLCPHDMGPLGDGCLEGHEIICPRHGARFDVRTGKVLCLPALADIRSFPVKVEGGNVHVRL